MRKFKCIGIKETELVKYWKTNFIIGNPYDERKNPFNHHNNDKVLCLTNQGGFMSYVLANQFEEIKEAE